MAFRTLLAPLLLCVLYSTLALCLRASDLFYVQQDAPGSCAPYTAKLDNAIDEAKSMVDSVLTALQLIEGNLRDIPTDQVGQRTQWVYFSMLYTTLFDPAPKTPSGGTPSASDDPPEPAGDVSNLLDGQGGSAAYQNVIYVFQHLQRTLNAPYDGTKHILCGDDWPLWRGAYDEDLLWQLESPVPRAMWQKFTAWFNSAPAGYGLWFRQVIPPGMQRTYEGSFKFWHDRPHNVPSGVICAGDVRAELIREFNALTICPDFLDEHVGALGETVQAGGIEEGSHISDEELISVSENWIHELLHWIPEVNYADELAVRIHDGQPVGGGVQAYGWIYAVALAAWDKPRALRNVENYVNFAKAVYLRQLAPEWSFLPGYATQEPLDM